MKTKIKKCLKTLGIFLVCIFAIWGVFSAYMFYVIVSTPGIDDPEYSYDYNGSD